MRNGDWNEELGVMRDLGSLKMLIKYWSSVTMDYKMFSPYQKWMVERGGAFKQNNSGPYPCSLFWWSLAAPCLKEFFFFSCCIRCAQVPRANNSQSLLLERYGFLIWGKLVMLFEKKNLFTKKESRFNVNLNSFRIENLNPKFWIFLFQDGL
jgi:hypothetical protein